MNNRPKQINITFPPAQYLGENLTSDFKTVYIQLCDRVFYQSTQKLT